MNLIQSKLQADTAIFGADTFFKCSVCGTIKKTPHGTCGTGYGRDPETDNLVCYACCAVRDRARMVETGKIHLYLTMPEDGAATVGNWPGTLTFTCGPVRKGRHNVAGVRYDTWFTGPGGARWHAVQYGNNTQIAHCKRVAQ